MTENDEPCMCGTPFTCLADVHDREVAMISHPSHPDQLMASALGVCWHSPTSDRWPCGPLRLCGAPEDVTHGPCVRIAGHTERWHGQPWHKDEDGTEWKP